MSAHSGFDRAWARHRPDAALDRIVELEDALRRVYMWISDPALKEDEDTSITEARRICRETLGQVDGQAKDPTQQPSGNTLPPENGAGSML